VIGSSDEASYRFRLLGPVEVLTGAGALPFARPWHRGLLALLLLQHGRLVTVERITEALWGGAAPASAVAQVQNAVSALRSMLAAGEVPVTVDRQPDGYLLRAPAELIDAAVFASLRERAAAAREPDRKVTLLRQALALWAGEPLGNVRASFAAAARLDLTEQRVTALESLYEAELARGRHREVTAELSVQVRAHPFREQLVGQLMLALYRSGRQVEALAAYRDAARAMADGHGLQPGTELRDLELRLLREDPGLQWQAPRPAPPAPAPAPAGAPAQLPPAVYGFTGRDRELAALDGLVGDTARREPGAPSVVALSGAAGVGKTALAVHWAHRAAGAHPDGQLYLDLRGFDPERPLEAGQALALLLRGLGVAGQQVPYELSERSALYRSLIAGRRLLVLLDNAGDTEQVRPLLPGTPSCTVLITSRDSLAGLVVRDGARRLDLDLLPADDASTLLRTLIGDRVEADPKAAALLARRCARLPLALRVAAELAVSRPDEPLADLAEELADEGGRLERLSSGDDVRAAVRSVFSWSYRRLPDDVARLFRLLGLHPGSASSASAAALAGDPVGRTAAGLDRLVRAHLAGAAARRYTMHDLLRAYAVELAESHDPQPARDAAMGRLFEHYLSTAAAAVAVLYRTGDTDLPDSGFADPEAALAWLDAERQSCVELTDTAGRYGLHRQAVRLAGILAHYLEAGGYRGTALRMHRNAAAAATALGDRPAEAAALARIGAVHFWWGRNAEAVQYGERALGLYRQAGDRNGEADVLINLGGIAWKQGRFPEALDRLEGALAVQRAAGDRPAVAKTLNNLGNIYGRTGQYPLSIEHYTRAAELAAELGDRVVLARALDNLGIRQQRQGDHEAARRASEQALAAFVAMGDRVAEAHARDNLAASLLSLGELDRAEQELARALEVFAETQEQDGIGEATSNLGIADRLRGRPAEAAARHTEVLELARRTDSATLEALAGNELGIDLALLGDHAGALARHRTALAVASRIDDPYEQARALDGIARAQLRAGEPDAAAESWRQALARFEALAVPQAEAVRAALAGVRG
jgi:DNA-binding SARP family transcriptional activator/Tfp pilus assembly protein PilF